MRTIYTYIQRWEHSAKVLIRSPRSRRHNVGTEYRKNPEGVKGVRGVRGSERVETGQLLEAKHGTLMRHQLF